MTEKQARKLKTGDRVMWNGNELDGGDVMDVGYAGMMILWDNGESSVISFKGDPRLVNVAT